MENDDELDISRLKRLLEESILQVEKENMAILQGTSKAQEKPSHSSRKSTFQTSQNVKAALPTKENGTDATSKAIHSNIHFLRDLQSSLLPNHNKRRIFVDETRDRYIPCAIPLSPPVRLKKEGDENLYSASSIQSSSEEQLSYQMFNKPLLKHTCYRSLPVDTRNRPSPVHTCNKSFRKDSVVIEKIFPTTIAHKEMRGFPLLPERKETQTKDMYENSTFEYINSGSPNDKTNNSTVFSNEKALNPKEDTPKPDKAFFHESANETQVPELKPHETFSQDNSKKNGFQLQISLDSTSTKDAIDGVLHKMQEFVNTFRTDSSDVNGNSCNSGQQRKNTSQHSHSSFDSQGNIPELNKIEKEQNEIISACNQTISDSSNTIPKFNNIPEIQIMPTSIETGQRKEDLLINRRELHHLVKNIVAESLQSMQSSEHIPLNAKMSCLGSKTDSGIQSEVENDAIEFNRHPKIDPSNNKKNFDQSISVPVINNSSKSVQVDINCGLFIQEKHDKCCNTENSKNLFELLESNALLDCNPTPGTDSTFLERNINSPAHETKNRIEMMLDKIYDYICQDKEAEKEITDISLVTPVRTRDVAVQFNPLHTSTKGTLTTEVKSMDSSSQCDIKLNTSILPKPNVDASIQTVCEAEPHNQHLQTNASTQCEEKNVTDLAVQTELLLSFENSAANTSVSSTPVSDSMFMDDMLSEGEVPLPWNLRLLSLGANMNVNNTDSSEASIKEKDYKDYSLSEGEIPPHVLRYLNINHYSLSEETDSFCDKYPSRHLADARMQHATLRDCNKASQSSANHKDLRLCNSSLSENECSSLSLGEVPHGFKISFLDSPGKADGNPFFRSNSVDTFPHDQMPIAHSTLIGSISDHSDYSRYFENEQHRDSDQANTQNIPFRALQMVNEEVQNL